MNRDFKVFAIILGFGLMGVIFAVFEYYMVENSIIMDEFLTGTITLQKLQIFTIVLFQMMGVFIAAT